MKITSKKLEEILPLPHITIDSLPESLIPPNVTGIGKPLYFEARKSCLTRAIILHKLGLTPSIEEAMANNQYEDIIELEDIPEVTVKLLQGLNFSASLFFRKDFICDIQHPLLPVFLELERRLGPYHTRIFLSDDGIEVQDIAWVVTVDDIPEDIQQIVQDKLDIALFHLDLDLGNNMRQLYDTHAKDVKMFTQLYKRSSHPKGSSGQIK